jgi:hypothetical protein
MSKKVYITEKQFNRIVENSSTSRNYKKDNTTMDYIKAVRKKRREEDKEFYGDGFKCNTKVRKSEKNYSRKGKNKFKNDFSEDNF